MIVVDASVAVLWTQEPDEDPRAEGAKQIVMALVDEGVLVPPIFAYEMANVIHHKKPHHDAATRRSILASIMDLVQQAPQAIHAVGALAERRGLSAYDAAYLELAQRRSATLLTEDAGLHAAGVKELGAGRCLRLGEAVEIWGV